MVFHVAAYVQTWTKNKQIFDDINVTGLINSVEAAKKVGIEKFIYTSSFMALGPSPKGGIINEDSDRITSRLHNDYERTKYLGLLEAGKIAETGFPIVTVHPTVIYGPGPLTSGNLVGKTIMDLINGKIPGVIGSGRQLWNYAHVNDVCKGHILAAEKGKPGERYILGGENISISDFMKLVGDMAGVEIPRRHLPIWLLFMVGAAQETIAFMGGKLPDMTRGIAGIYALNWAYSSEKAEKELGYSPISLKKGLEETVKWIKNVLEEEKR
jgi:farnesol dehydrogenase